MTIHKYDSIFIVSSSLNPIEHVIMDCPSNYEINLDGVFCHDNKFINEEIIPCVKGVYKLYCTIISDDGISGGLIENSDPDLQIKIEKVEQLFIINS